MVVSSLNSGCVKFWARVGPVMFFLSLIFLVLMGYFCLFILMLTDTIQWSEMNPCNVVLMMSKLLLSCGKFRSEVFPLTCVGPDMWCSRPIAFIVSMKMTASALVRSPIWILKSPSMILFWYWGSLLTIGLWCHWWTSHLLYCVPHLMVDGRFQLCYWFVPDGISPYCILYCLDVAIFKKLYVVIPAKD